MRLKLISLNVRGLQAKVKRHSIFKICRLYGIALLQETHITESSHQSWTKEWGGRLFYSVGTNRSKGQVILINKNLEIKDVNVIHASERILALSLEIDDDTYNIVNIYAPNSTAEVISFLQNITLVISNLDQQSKLIIGGDFNTIYNNRLDNIAGKNHDIRESVCFNNFIHSLGLIDTWRFINKSTKEFTWSRVNPFTARRLDYIFCNQNAMSTLIGAHHKLIEVSDHKGVVVELQTHRFVRGPPLWKFNNSLLSDTTFIDKINEKLDHFLEENNNRDPQTKWELLKFEIKNTTMIYAGEKSNRARMEYEAILKELEGIEKAVSNMPSDPLLNRLLSERKNKLNIMELHKAKGAQIRSRIKYVEEGEKNTQYFLNLEKN